MIRFRRILVQCINTSYPGFRTVSRVWQQDRKWNTVMLWQRGVTKHRHRNIHSTNFLLTGWSAPSSCFYNQTYRVLPQISGWINTLLCVKSSPSFQVCKRNHHHVMRFLFFFHADIFPVFHYFHNRLLILFFCLASNHLSWHVCYSLNHLIVSHLTCVQIKMIYVEDVCLGKQSMNLWRK